MDILTVKQVSDELGITAVTVRRYCQEGRLGRKFGRQWLITRDELEKFKKIKRKVGRPPKDEE